MLFNWNTLEDEGPHGYNRTQFAISDAHLYIETDVVAYRFSRLPGGNDLGARPRYRFTLVGGALEFGPQLILRMTFDTLRSG